MCVKVVFLEVSCEEEFVFIKNVVGLGIVDIVVIVIEFFLVFK